MRFAAKVVAILMLSSPVWAADPFFGTWKLDKSRSTMGSSNFQSRTFVISGDAKTHHIVQKDVMPDGKMNTTERDEVFDGKEHPGIGGALIVSKRVNASTKTFVSTKDGKTVRTATDTISADGKTFTHDVRDLTRNENRIWVFERE